MFINLKIINYLTVSKVDESNINGESQLVEKKLGDPNLTPLLISGTIMV
jgi:hypothetical protein